MSDRDCQLDAGLLINNDTWQTGPSFGFLTPTGFSQEIEGRGQFIYGAVRDNLGRGVIRGVSISPNLQISAFSEVSYDRRGSGSFDTDGTILGHVNSVDNIVRLYYIGFRKSQRVKFEAFSGLAESLDGGKTFSFKRRIFDEDKFTFLEDYAPDIVACHWNNLDVNGDGLALIAVGNGWLDVGSVSYPKYSSYLINVKNFQFTSLISRFPQKSEVYRLGRPRFLENKMKIAVATGGKDDGDYRPYFFEFTGSTIIERADITFEVEPGSYSYCRQQVSYPELIKFANPKISLFLFNGDNMGHDGCYGFTTKDS
jgi:hypothetical protein